MARSKYTVFQSTMGHRDDVQTTGAVALLLETAVTDFSQPVEKHCPGQRMARLALVQLGRDKAGCTTATRLMPAPLFLGTLTTRVQEGVYVPGGSFDPAGQWAQGNPLIEREQITTIYAPLSGHWSAS